MTNKDKGLKNFKINIFRELRWVITPSFCIRSITDPTIYDYQLIAALTLNQKLMNLGYTLKVEDIIDIAKYQLTDHMKEIFNDVKIAVGDVKAKPMYSNFPLQVMEMPEAQFRLHQLMHYFSTYGLESLTGIPIDKGWLPNVEDTEKTEYDKSLLDLKVLKAYTCRDAVKYSFKKLISKNERLTIPEQEIINYDLLYRETVLGDLNQYEIKFKENLYEIFYAVFTSESYNDYTAYRFCQHTGDVWKCIDYIMNEKGIKHFRTSQKRVLVKLLESYPIADFKANLILSNKSANRVKYMLNALSYNMYSKSPAHKDAVYALRDNALVSWEGQAKALIFSHDDEALQFIAQRPGMMLRMITLLHRNGYKFNDIAEVLSSKASELSTQTLVTLLTYFYRYKVNAYGSNDNYAGDELFIMRTILAALLGANLKSKSIAEIECKNIYIDMDNYNLELSNIECNNKSSEGGYIRSGLAYKIPDNVQRIRFFVYWNDKRRIDIDLHGTMLFTNGDERDIGWNKDFKNDVSVFSGDITHSDAAEYIDINLDNDTLSKVECNINVFTGENFADIDECFVGIMAVNSLGETVKLYDPKNCFFTHYLKGDIKTMEYGFIDVKSRSLVFVGKESKCYNDNKFYASKFSVQDYIKLLLFSQKACISKSKEDADVILTMEKSEDDNAISLLDENFFMER